MQLSGPSISTTDMPRPHASEELTRLDARVVPCWIVSGMLSVGFLVGLGWVGLLFLGDRLGAHQGLVLHLSLLVGGVLLLGALLQPWLAYVFWRYAIGEKLLLAQYGILFRAEKTIPISRLQHIDLHRGPIERLFGLATLVVFTAGTEEATFRVPGLAVPRARELRDRILAARGDDVI